MRKVSLFLLILIALPILFGHTQELKRSPLEGVLMVSGWNDAGFSHPMDYGAKLGIQVPLDTEKGFSLRTTYCEWNLRQGQIASAMTNTFIVDWYVGHKWSFYTTLLGAETYVSGPIDGTDFFTGLGVSRRVLTADPAGYKSPFYCDIFGDITLSKTANWTTSQGESIMDYIQINVGVKFGRPVK